MTRFFKKSFFYSISLLMLSSLFVTGETSATKRSMDEETENGAASSSASKRRITEVPAVESTTSESTALTAPHLFLHGSLAAIRQFVLQKSNPDILSLPRSATSSPLQKLPRNAFSVVASFLAFEDLAKLGQVSKSACEWGVPFADLRTAFSNKLTLLSQKTILSSGESRQYIFLIGLNRIFHEILNTDPSVKIKP